MANHHVMSIISKDCNKDTLSPYVVSKAVRREGVVEDYY